MINRTKGKYKLQFKSGKRWLLQSSYKTRSVANRGMTLEKKVYDPRRRKHFAINRNIPKTQWRIKKVGTKRRRSSYWDW